MNDERERRTAGGMATQRGIDFQNRVAAWFAVHTLAEQGGQSELPAGNVNRFYFETSEPVSDLMLATDRGGFIFVEVKHSISLAPSDIHLVLRQFVRQWAVCETSVSSSAMPWRRPLRPVTDRLLLVTSDESPIALRKHLANCLLRAVSFDEGQPITALAHNQEEESALSKFCQSLTEVWEGTVGRTQSSSELLAFLKVVRIMSLDVEAGHLDENRAVSTLSTFVLQKPAEAQAAWSALLRLCGSEAADRRSSTVTDLQQSLEDSGLLLSTSRNYRADIAKLEAVTKRTMKSLEHLASLRAIPQSVSIDRAVTRAIEANAIESSLLIVGEPGAGKSGVLFELAKRATTAQRQDVVLLAVDRLEGSLKSDLGLEHSVDEVLLEWKGNNPALLIIDALDAARGSPVSAAILALIRAIVESKSRWRVVASIRSFDLKYSPELQDIFRKTGPGASPQFEQERFAALHHVSIPVFSDEEIREICDKMPSVAAVLSAAAPQFTQLLRTPFNLRLLCELLVSGISAIDLSALRTTIALLNRYWTYRVLSPVQDSKSREKVLTFILEQMKLQRRLSIQAKSLLGSTDDAALAALLSNQVLVEQEENVVGRYILCFSHHLLFDYAASRLLILSDPQTFIAQLSAEHDLGLFLRPSIVLVFRELWSDNREYFWSLARLLSRAEAKIPAVARLIAPMVLAEQVVSLADLKPLQDSLQSPKAEERELAEQWFLHSVGAMLADNHIHHAAAWAEFATDIAAATPSRRILGGLQALISLLIEQVPSNNHVLRQLACCTAPHLSP